MHNIPMASFQDNSVYGCQVFEHYGFTDDKVFVKKANTMFLDENNLYGATLMRPATYHEENISTM